ncbi:MAG: hypothetical protein ABEI74_04210 [Candidatus Pacearchaeota archaeon]
MNFIKEVFDEKSTDSMHLQFQKFSKGKFANKAMIEAKKRGNKYAINTTPEFANEMVRTVAKKLGDEKARVTGCIVSTLDISDQIPHKDIKQFQGVKRYLLDEEMSGNDVLSIMEKLPKNFFGLSFSTPDKNYELKVKPKAPKSAKPSTKTDEKPKVDFCKLKTTDPEFAGEFIFEKPDFKEASLSHTFVIEDLEIPKEAKESGDYKRMREEAIRKGKVIREGTIDGEEIKQEKEFAA